MGMGLPLVILVLAAMAQHLPYCGGGAMDYGQALSNSTPFPEAQAQRSGVLHGNQRRPNSGLLGGNANVVDLTGGCCGDVKVGLPMACTVTRMAWSVLEYGELMGPVGELGQTAAVDAIKWGTDCLVKAHPEPNVLLLYGEVWDGDTDHNCSPRPEDMSTTSRRLDTQHPGSDLAGETAAAMAAASLVFRGSNPGYANNLLRHSKQLFDFADKYRGRYDVSIVPVAMNYYGYGDELLWAAAWLFHATGDAQYLDYLANNADALGGTRWSSSDCEFGWDIKYPAVQVLAAKILLQGKAGAHAAVLQRYQKKADFFACSCIGKLGSSGDGQRTPDSLMKSKNLEFVTSVPFLLLAYSDSLAAARGVSVQCPSGSASPSEIMAFAKSQADYIILSTGSNTRAREAYHPGASVRPNPAFASFRDDLADGEQADATTYKYNSVPFVAVLARLAAGQGGSGRFLNSVDQDKPPWIEYVVRVMGAPIHADETLAIVAPIATYWITSAIYALLAAWFPDYRLHSKVEENRRNLVPKIAVFRMVVLMQFLQAAVSIAFFKVTGPRGAESSTGPTSAFVLAGQFLVAMLVLDTWQYLGHRLMHQNRFLYRHVHSFHHRLVAPYAFAAQYNHPVEALFLDTLSGALAVFISGMSPRATAYFISFTTMKAVDDHAGMLIPWNPLHILFANNTGYHDVHHQVRGNKGNFAQPFFRTWDVLMGTQITFTVVRAGHGGLEAVPGGKTA